MESLLDAFRRLPSPALGAWIKIPSQESCEILACAGFDYLVVDLEHSQLSMDDAFRLISITTLSGLPAIVRMPELNAVAYQRILDSGATAILAPQLESARDVEAGLSLCLYPPRGRRGFSSTTRAGAWGARGMEEHVAHSNSEVTFIPQLESRTALEAIDDIISVDGLAAVFIGQADLSVSSGFPRDSPELEKLTDAVLSACNQRQVLVGTAVSSVASVEAGSGDDYDFVVVGDDVSMLSGSARQTARDMRAALSSRMRPRPDSMATRTEGDTWGGPT